MARSGSASDREAPGAPQRLPASGTGGFAAGAGAPAAGDAAAAAGAPPDPAPSRACLRRQGLAALAQLVLVLLEALGEHSLGMGHRGAKLGDVVLALAAGGAELGHPRATADGQLALVLPETAVEAASSGLHLGTEGPDVLLAGRVGLHGDEGRGGRRGGSSGSGRLRGGSCGVVACGAGAGGFAAGAAAGGAPTGCAPGGGGGGVWAMASTPASPAARNSACRTFMGPLPARGGPDLTPFRGGTVARHRTKVPWSPDRDREGISFLAMRLPGPMVRGVLSPNDRASEVLFGLIMALTLTGALSATSATAQETRVLFVSTLACNVAWGFVDAVMYVLNEVLGRGRQLLLDQALREGTAPAEIRTVLAEVLPWSLADGLSAANLEEVRRTVAAHPDLHRRRGSRDRTWSPRSACSSWWWPAPSRWHCPSW